MGDCIRCHRRPIKVKRRGLCRSCYSLLCRNGRLVEFPKIFSLPDNSQYLRLHPGIETDLKRLFNDPHITLREVGEKHGITRERVRQIFYLYHGVRYTAAKFNHADERQRQRDLLRVLKKDPRHKLESGTPGTLIYKGAMSEKRVLDVCESLHYEVKPYLPDKSIDLVVNGYLVDVKSAYKTTLTSPHAKTPLYHFQISNKQRHNADFFVCHAVDINKFFVIPADQCQTNHLYIPCKKVRTWIGWKGGAQRRESKWYRFEEAWHLLKRKPEEVFFVKPEIAPSLAATA